MLGIMVIYGCSVTDKLSIDILQCCTQIHTNYTPTDQLYQYA